MVSPIDKDSKHRRAAKWQGPGVSQRPGKTYGEDMKKMLLPPQFFLCLSCVFIFLDGLKMQKTHASSMKELRFGA